MNMNCVITTGEKMTADERLTFVRATVEKYRMSHGDLARYTGYAVNSVVGWFTYRNSPRHRCVPARAVDRLLLELQSGHVKGSK